MTISNIIVFPNLEVNIFRGLARNFDIISALDSMPDEDAMVFAKKLSNYLYIPTSIAEAKLMLGTSEWVDLEKIREINFVEMHDRIALFVGLGLECRPPVVGERELRVKNILLMFTLSSMPPLRPYREDPEDFIGLVPKMYRDNYKYLYTGPTKKFTYNGSPTTIIRNSYNSCYFAAPITVLFTCRRFRNFLFDSNFSPDSTGDLLIRYLNSAYGHTRESYNILWRQFCRSDSKLFGFLNGDYGALDHILGAIFRIIGFKESLNGSRGEYESVLVSNNDTTEIITEKILRATRTRVDLICLFDLPSHNFPVTLKNMPRVVDNYILRGHVTHEGSHFICLVAEDIHQNKFNVHNSLLDSPKPVEQATEYSGSHPYLNFAYAVYEKI